jgi:arylsulfatase A-like enzyme
MSGKNPHCRCFSRCLLIAACVVLVLSTSLTSAEPSRGQSKLNVVFILADDLGWSDTTLYGHTRLYETPNIQRLAERGMTFTRAYSNSPLCSPTRASAMTGQAVARHGSTAPQHHMELVRMQAEVQAKAPPGNKALQCESVTRLDTAIPTLAKQLKQAGYATAHFGKWHLGPEPFSPLQHGFDVDLPHHPGPGPAGSFVAPWTYNGGRFTPNEPKEHIEDRMAAEAVRWLQAQSNDQPFYLNYWQFSVHAPFDAKQELIAYYRPKIDRSSSQASPTYAAMVHSLDDAVGTLLDAIDAKGIADRTVIVFYSDNGGNMYNGIRETGMDGETYVTAPTSNAPLRGGKATMFEGGIRMPCVICWPGRTQPGSRSDEPIQTSDFYPTFLNQLGIAAPANHAIDGIDITPALQGGHLDRQAIFTYFPHSPSVPDWLPPAISVHKGDWKLIRLFHQGDDGQHDYLLYHLGQDLGETNNLAAEHPDIVRQLDALIDQHITATGAVVPQPNPDFDPSKYQPETIGVQPGGLRVAGEAAKPAPKSKPPVHTTVGGWRSGGTCSIRLKQGSLVINSTGGDPFVHVAELKPSSGGPFSLSVRIKSNARGDSVVFYNRPFHHSRTVPLPLEHDGQWQESRAEIPVDTLDALRIDPATGPGTIQIESVRLLDASGREVAKWQFE